MKKRLRSRVLAVGMVGSSLLGAGAILYIQDPTRAQDKPAASELLNRGSQLFENRQFPEAKKVLLEVDPAQLPEDQRTKLAELLKKTDIQLAKAAEGTSAYDQAKVAMDAGRLAEAKAKFDAVVKDANTPRDVRENAKLQLALVKEKQKEKTPEMKQLLKQGIKAYEDGRLDEAQSALETIQATGSDLGWADSGKPAKYQRLITEKRAALAKAAAKPAVLAPAAPAVAEAPNPVPAAPVAAPAPAAKPVEVKPVQVAQAAPAPAPAAAPAPVAAPAPAPVAPAPVAAGAEIKTVAAPAESAPAVEAAAPQNDILSEMLQADELRRQRAIAIYDLAIKHSQEAIGAKDFNTAVDRATVARDTILTSRQFFSDKEYNSRLAAAEKQLRVAQAERAKFDQTQAQVARTAAEKRDRDLAVERRTQREARVNQLMEDSKKAYDQQRFEECRDLLRQVVAIDPQNYGARFSLQQVEDKLIYLQWDANNRGRALETQRIRLQTEETMIPYSQLLIYPEEWPEISRRRAGDTGTQESEPNRRLRQKLDAEIGVIEIDQRRIEDVLKYLADSQGINIFVNWPQLEQVGVQRNAPVSMNLRQVTLRKALDTVLSQAAGSADILGYVIDDGVLSISSKTELSASKFFFVRVYDIRDLLIRPEEVVQSDFQLQGGGSGSGSVGQFTQNNTRESKSSSQAKTDSAERTEEIKNLIMTSVSSSTWQAGGGTGGISEYNGQLVINQTADVHEKVLNLLQQLRESGSVQIAVESRFLLVASSFLEDFGFDWNIGIQNIGNAKDGIGFGNNKIGNVIAQPGSNPVPGALTQSSNAFSIGSATSAGTGSLSLLLDDVTVNMFLRATQASKNTVYVNAPKVTLFNGGTAQIQVMTQEQYIEKVEQSAGTTSTTGTVSGSTTITTSTLSTGVSLWVRGAVSADRRYVRLNLLPQMQTRDQMVPVYSNALGTEGLSAGADRGRLLAMLPTVTKTTVETTASIPDGGTLLIGGQKIAGETEVETGVPILSKIPGINRLFTNRSVTRDERTLLVLVRPKIIIQREEEFKSFGVNFDSSAAATAFGGGAAAGAAAGAGAGAAAGR